MAQIEMNNKVTFTVTTPKEMVGNLDMLSELVKLFELEFSKEEKGMSKYKLAVFAKEKKYNDLVLRGVQEVYWKAGWKTCIIERAYKDRYIVLHLKES